MKKILFLFLALILLPIVTAQIEISDQVIKSDIIPDESAKYILSIKNEGNTPDIFGIAVSDVNWREKIEDDFLEIGSGETVRTDIGLTPNKGLKAGRYSIELRVYSRTNPNNVKDHMIIVDLIPYEDLVDVIFETNPNGLDPRRENLIRLNLKNKHSLELKDVNIKLTSNLFEKTRNVDLNPAELRSEEFSIFLDEDTERGEYDVKTVVSYNGNIIVDRTEKLMVGFYKEVNEDEVIGEGFLINKKKIVKSNNGNVDSEEVVRERFNSFESLFTSVYPEPSVIYNEDDMVYYEWRFTLAPAEVYKINITTNYRTPISILIAIIVIAWLAYILFFGKVSIKKKVLTVMSGKDVDMKIMLVLKNNGKNKVSNISVLDYLPRGAKSPTEYGAIKPNRYKGTSRGSAIVWKLNDMVEGEERVISYRVKISPANDIAVPRAVVKYISKGKTRMSKSNANHVRT